MARQNSIAELRKFIHDMAIKNRFLIKGGKNFIKINSGDTLYIFNLYDKLFFSDQIKERLKKTNSTLSFYVRGRVSGVGGVCGIENVDLKPNLRRCNYYFDVAPNIIERTNEEDRVYGLQLIMEHEIVHLLMLLWKFTHKRGVIYEKHGRLYQCMLREYFGHYQIDHDLGLSTVDDEIEGGPCNYKSPGTGKPSLFINWGNSCYIDSLLMILFLGESPFYRRIILGTDVSTFSYKDRDGKFIKFCQESSKIDSEVKVRAMTMELQNYFCQDYKRITGERTESLKCFNVRKLLRQCYPDLLKYGRWVQYNPENIYDLIAELFPPLKLRDIPTMVRIPSEILPRLTFRDVNSFQANQFLEPPGIGERPMWNKINTNVLVFSVLLPIKDYGSEGVEIINGEKVIKIRAFGEYIIDDRYKLFGVVMNTGRLKGAEGGGHYFSYIKTIDDQWHIYDDFTPSYKSIDELPRDVFKYKSRVRPVMFFYQKIKDYKGIDIKTVPRSDGYVYVFATDFSPTLSFIPEMDKLSPRTRIENTRIWRVEPKHVDALMKVIRKLDLD